MSIFDCPDRDVSILHDAAVEWPAIGRHSRVDRVDPIENCHAMMMDPTRSAVRIVAAVVVVVVEDVDNKEEVPRTLDYCCMWQRHELQ
jgi:hypothetical protein